MFFFFFFFFFFFGGGGGYLCSGGFISSTIKDTDLIFSRVNNHSISSETVSGIIVTSNSFTLIEHVTLLVIIVDVMEEFDIPTLNHAEYIHFFLSLISKCFHYGQLLHDIKLQSPWTCRER